MKKETKQMQRAEMKALKKGGAPKSVIKHEREEHSAMNRSKKSSKKK